MAVPVETSAQFISDLNESAPTGGEKLGQVDDHLRIIKKVIKATFPAITGVVSLTHTVLNALPTRIAVFEDNFLVSGVVKLVNALDANTKAITNLADPTSAQDADTKHARDAAITTALAALFPVGAVYLTFVTTNPGTLLGFGTWSQVAQGELLVGVGSGTDQNAVSRTYTAGDNAGAYRHTLLASELPAGVVTDVSFVNGTGASAANFGTQQHIDATVTPAATAFAIVPPTYGVYVWRRTA